MSWADALTLHGATLEETRYLEDTALRRLVLDLYDAEHVAIRRYLAYLGIDAETVRELLQDCFLKLHQHLLSGGDRSNLRAWLYQVAHNLARNLQASNYRARTIYLPDALAGGEPPSENDSVEQELLNSERQRRFHRALADLPTAQRETLLLRSRGLKYREIAEILNLSVSTVGENIQRGMDSLKVLIAT